MYTPGENPGVDTVCHADPTWRNCAKEQLLSIAPISRVARAPFSRFLPKSEPCGPTAPNSRPSRLQVNSRATILPPPLLFPETRDRKVPIDPLSRICFLRLEITPNCLGADSLRFIRLEQERGKGEGREERKFSRTRVCRNGSPSAASSRFRREFCNAPN